MNSSTSRDMSLIDDIVARLIEVGAATAANSETGLREAVRDLQAAGVSETRIREAIGIGQMVRDKPAGVMKEAADALTGTSLLQPRTLGECPASKLAPGAVLDVAMLIASGAAMEANCEPCLEKAVLTLTEAGVDELDIRRAVEIGQAVKDRAGSLAVEAATGRRAA